MISYLEILDLIQQGQWDKAHGLVQHRSDSMACLIHAYLHSIEGDLDNARYWYARANEIAPCNTLDEEYQRLSSLIKGQC